MSLVGQSHHPHLRLRLGGFWTAAVQSAKNQSLLFVSFNLHQLHQYKPPVILENDSWKRRSIPSGSDAKQQQQQQSCQN